MDKTSETLRSLTSQLARTEFAAAKSLTLNAHDLELLNVPDSHVCREAERICREASSESLANHCFRSYAWGALLGTADGIKWDAELFYVASMLHDLGLTETYDRGGCFEQDSAQAAREILSSVGWPTPRAEIVADAIYLHMHELTEEHSAEAHLLTFGTSADVSGSRALEIDKGARALVLELFPRIGFKEVFIELFAAQAAEKPGCAVHHYMENGLADRIRMAPYEE